MRKNDLYMRIAFGVWFVIATLQADPAGKQSVWLPLWLASLAVLAWFTYQDWQETRQEKSDTAEKTNKTNPL